MKGSDGSWWGWLFWAFILMAVFGRTGIPVLPLIIGFVVLASVFGGGRRISSHRHHGPSGGTAGPHGVEHPGAEGVGPASSMPHDRGMPTTDVPGGSPMPTIDVPRYPGDGPVPGTPPSWPYRQAGPPPSSHGEPPTPPPSSQAWPPPSPPSSQAWPPPPPSYGHAGSPPPPPPPDPGPGAVPTPPVGAGAPHTSTDPVVSLGQLHLSRCGRDLQAAGEQGNAAEVERVLEEVRDLSRRMQDMLGAADGTPDSGRREFRAGLRALDRLVDDARGEHPPGARLTRVTQACLRMGQTGRYE